MGSSRFPGKVMADLEGTPVLEWVVRRCAAALRVGAVVVATTSLPEDDVIEQFCSTRGLPCYRGSVDDVLDRFCRAAERFELDVVVRVTSDCPLVDPALIDDLLEALHLQGADYVTNSMPMRLPHGFEASAMTRAALERAAAEATRAADREHVTLFMRDHPDRFALHALKYEVDAYDLRVTIDHPVDLEVVRFVARALGDRSPYGAVEEVIRILRAHPEVAALNAMHPPGEGLARSLAADRERS